MDTNPKTVLDSNLGRDVGLVAVVVVIVIIISLVCNNMYRIMWPMIRFRTIKICKKCIFRISFQPCGQSASKPIIKMSVYGRMNFAGMRYIYLYYLFFVLLLNVFCDGEI